MLYPDFNDLVAYKKRRFGKVRLSGNVKSHAPGAHHSPFRGQGLEFDAVREYVPGDDIRNIDWRVTARMGTPHLKVFKEEHERQQLICIDVNATMRFGTKNTFKSVQAAHIAAFLGWKGLQQQDKVGACLFGDVPRGLQFFSPKRTGKAFCAVLKTLSEPPQEQHRTPLANVLEPLSKNVKTGSLLFFISDFMHPLPDQKAFSKLTKRCEVVFIVLHDPADCALFPFGQLNFSNQGKDRISINTNDCSAKYEADWKKSRNELREIALNLKIPVIELTTESDVYQELYRTCFKR
jgi:uncharacterized protein (DUF58 family)